MASFTKIFFKGKETNKNFQLRMIRNVLLLLPLMLWGAEFLLLKRWFNPSNPNKNGVLPPMEIFITLLAAHLCTFVYPAGRVFTKKPSFIAALYLTVIYGACLILNFAWTKVPGVSVALIIYSQILTLICFVFAFRAAILTKEGKNTLDATKD